MWVKGRLVGRIYADTEFIINLQLQPKDFTLLARILYMDPGDGVWGEFELDYVLILQKDVDIKPNPDEVADIQYVPRNKFDNFIANLKYPVTPWFKLMYRHMLPYWWDNLHRLDEIAEPQKIRSFVKKL
ncbi:isopentenyl-diphosphate Delta-isomerase II-like [Trichoplusia ni]|uniref:Isopentenyl-diphosphate Delta-isomerase II-like n=1 Tax=Trichoplusia ni TaxID=7111 RepID=A0A7E5WRT4_TRINI|nr:isopentenyl-diphosphate Delta-isomerase II-like [Trichoplusia ni]